MLAGMSNAPITHAQPSLSAEKQAIASPFNQ